MIFKTSQSGVNFIGNILWIMCFIIFTTSVNAKITKDDGTVKGWYSVSCTVKINREILDDKGYVKEEFEKEKPLPFIAPVVDTKIKYISDLQNISGTGDSTFDSWRNLRNLDFGFHEFIFIGGVQFMKGVFGDSRGQRVYYNPNHQKFDTTKSIFYIKSSEWDCSLGYY